jgi:hypothetical protein
MISIARSIILIGFVIYSLFLGDRRVSSRVLVESSLYIVPCYSVSKVDFEISVYYRPKEYIRI